MPDPNVRDVGEVEDIDGFVLVVGVDFDTVTLSSRGERGAEWRLPQAAAEEFARLFVSASWQAARQVPGDG